MRYRFTMWVVILYNTAKHCSVHTIWIPVTFWWTCKGTFNFLINQAVMMLRAQMGIYGYQLSYNICLSSGESKYKIICFVSSDVMQSLWISHVPNLHIMAYCTFRYVDVCHLLYVVYKSVTVNRLTVNVQNECKITRFTWNVAFVRAKYTQDIFQW